MLCFLFIFLLPIFTKNTIIIIIILFYFTFSFIEYFFIGLFQFFTFQDISWIFWKYVLFCIGNSMICSDIWHKYHGWYFKIVIGNFTSLWASEIWDNFEIIITSDIYAKYHVQIMLLLVYATTREQFVIFTSRYFKLSWNTTGLSQSNWRLDQIVLIRWSESAGEGGLLTFREGNAKHMQSLQILHFQGLGTKTLKASLFSYPEGKGTWSKNLVLW